MQVDNLTVMKNKKNLKYNVSTGVKELEEMDITLPPKRPRRSNWKAVKPVQIFLILDSLQKKGEKWKTVSISCSALGGAKLTRT